MSTLDPGQTIVVSCGEVGNGVIGAYSVAEKAKWKDAITIAFNGYPLATTMHPYEFAAKDDVAVAAPLKNLPPEVIVYIQAVLNSEMWRFTYYRKCFPGKTSAENNPLASVARRDQLHQGGA
jgi:type I restriction enzyme M protein